MPLSMSSASVPAFLRALRNLRHLLAKGEAHAREQGADIDPLPTLKLVDDMLPLSRQVQIACDMAKNGAARLAGLTPPAFADEETTLAQLFDRIDRTVAYVESLDAASIDGSEGREIVLDTRAGELRFNGQDYLTTYVLPNLYFHVTTAYALLRRDGVPLGKSDYLLGAGAHG